MKITYFINQYPKVSHSFIRREILALEKQGIEVQRVSLRGWDAETVDFKDDKEKRKTYYLLEKGITPLLISTASILTRSPVKFIVTFMLIIKLNRNTERSFLSHLICLAEACHLLSFLYRNKSEHIHSHFGTNSTDVVMLANSLGGPSYSFTVHGPEEFDKPKSINLTEKIIRAKFVAAISSFGRSQLYRWVDSLHWHKIRVIHCGLEREFYDIDKSKIPDNPRLVCVGRLCEQKGQILLIEACNKLKRRGVEFELILAGDGELRQEIERLIDKYELDKHVKIMGWVSSSEVRKELLSSRGMILPSFAEGLPVVIMEAMSLRRAVLTTYVAGIPELIENGKSGILFPAGDVNLIVKAIENFLAISNDSLHQMVDIAFDQVIRQHNIDNEASKLVKLFKSCQMDSY